MESESSIPCLQELANSFYPETEESSPLQSAYFFTIQFNIASFILAYPPNILWIPRASIRDKRTVKLSFLGFIILILSEKDIMHFY
jgi:hypothetical protein